MAVSLNNLMHNEGPAIYYDKAFRSVLEDHMSYLRSHPSTAVVVIDAGKAYQYANNWNGLLSCYQVAPELRWLTMRMNNRTSETDSLEGVEVILVPDRTVVEYIRQSYTSTNRIS